MENLKYILIAIAMLPFVIAIAWISFILAYALIPIIIGISVVLVIYFAITVKKDDPRSHIFDWKDDFN